MQNAIMLSVMVPQAHRITLSFRTILHNLIKTKLRLIYIGDVLSSKMPAKATVALLSLVPWMMRQQVRLILFVAALLKEPRKALPLLLLLALLITAL